MRSEWINQIGHSNFDWSRTIDKGPIKDQLDTGPINHWLRDLEFYWPINHWLRDFDYWSIHYVMKECYVTTRNCLICLISVVVIPHVVLIS